MPCPRLTQLQRQLYCAACAAYAVCDWDYAILDDEEANLWRLLALNYERAPS